MDKQFRLFLGCFVALVATSFGFIVRATIINEWREDFQLSGEQIGNIQGAGLYPFAISIILLSLVIDKLGYGRTMVFAFVGHVVSAIMTLTASSYQMLYWATFLYALSNGAVEAVINPVVATLYDKEKTHWLNILHAGWPGGLVLGGLLAIFMSVLPGVDGLPGQLWQWKMALILLPTAAYGFLLFGQKFPVQERVAEGVSDREMLREFGVGSCYIVSYLMIMGVSQILGVIGIQPLDWWVPLLIAVVPTIIFAIFIPTFGRPMFVFLLLVMFLLATTELGTDSWIAAIMEKVLASPEAGALVLVYTSFIMFVLRFFAGPIVHRISPLGLLAASAAIATGGLLWLSNAGSAGWAIFLAATCYGVGKTFFWPTTLGVVSEQYPKGGALLLNTVAGVGVLAVGVLGAPILGNLQDVAFDQEMKATDAALHAKILTEKEGMLGDYKALDQEKKTKMTEDLDNIRDQTVQQLTDQLGKTPTQSETDEALQGNPDYHSLQDNLDTINQIDRRTKQGTLAKIAVLPAIMFVCYLVLIGYYRGKGGYRVEVLTGHAAKDEKFTGGVEGPAEP